MCALLLELSNHMTIYEIEILFNIFYLWLRYLSRVHKDQVQGQIALINLALSSILDFKLDDLLL